MSELDWQKLRGAVDNRLLDVIKEDFKFTNMTPVQSATIPLFIANKDVAVEAVTGSGKTLAFVIPILQMLLKRSEPLKKHDIGCLIITPVRELAMQINEVLQPFLTKLEGKFTSMLLTGGTDIKEDAHKFQSNGGNILIGTPGRIEYLLADYGTIFNTRELEVLVLDEADRLLDMGFQIPLNIILGKLPKQRRTGLFSATLTSDVAQIIRAGLRNPVKVTIKVQNIEANDTQRIPRQLENFFTFCDSDAKLPQLIHFLHQNKDKKIIVYFLTCACVDYFFKIISTLDILRGISILSTHSKVPQKKREVNSTDLGMVFYCPQICLLVGLTFLMSIGLFNIYQYISLAYGVMFDPPQDPDAFVHRIGRTARAGKDGSALLYLLPSEDSYIEFLKVKKVPITERQTFSDVVKPDILKAVKEEMMHHRELMEKAQIAFVSYIRAYKSHRLSYIFQLDKLDIGKLATGFALLRLPKMPELKNLTLQHFAPTIVDFNSIPYQDKQREQHRQKKLHESTTAATVNTNDKSKKTEKKRKRSSAPQQKETKLPEQSTAPLPKKQKKHKRKKIKAMLR